MCIVSSLSKAGDIGADSSDVNYTESVRGLAERRDLASAPPEVLEQSSTVARAILSNFGA
jgi:hypothetical protein